MPGIALAAIAHRDPVAPALVSPERPLWYRCGLALKLSMFFRENVIVPRHAQGSLVAEL